MAAMLRALTLNWKLKLLALALAVLLWVVVSAEQVTSNWIPVPLAVSVEDPEFRLRAASVPDEVSVRFSGPGRELWDVAIRRPPLRLVITEVEDTLQPFPLEPRMVILPNELSVIANDVRPSSVRLRFAEIASRRLPVVVQVEEELPAGWTLVDGLRVQPAEVRVSGPAAQLADLSVIRTLPVPLSVNDSVFSRVVPLDTSALGALEISAGSVEISGRVERVVERVISDVPISLGNGVGVRPATVDVRVRGASSKVQALSRERLRVAVSIDSIPAQIPLGGLVVPLRVEQAGDGVIAEAQPRTVRLLPSPPDTLGVPAERGDTTAVLGVPTNG